MRKIILTILASAWFVPVIFFGGTYIGMAGLCAQQKCARYMSEGDVPHRLFHVLVHSAAEPSVVEAVLLTSLPDYLASNPGASLRLPTDHGLSKYGDWKFSVESDDASGQIVTASFFDDASIKVKYKVVDNKVVPLFSEVTNSGHLFTSVLFVGIPLAWAVRKVARKFVKIEGSRNSKSPAG